MSVCPSSIGPWISKGLASLPSPSDEFSVDVTIADWHNGYMVRRQPTVEIDEKLIEAARAVARRSGVPEEELYERALRDVLVRDFDALMDEIAKRQAATGVSLTDDEAMALAVEEVRAARNERRSAS